MDALAVVMEGPERLTLSRLPIAPPTEDDAVVAMEWSGVSAGTERLLWRGRMPKFPGMGYPLVPGYESVGLVVEAGSRSGLRTGDRVFVPGAKCFGAVRGLFGGAASRVTAPGARLTVIEADVGEDAVMLALAATARHALADPKGRPPQLIVGHGALGRLLARISLALGDTPVVWETNPTRLDGAEGYEVLHPDADPRRAYDSIYDASGDAGLLDTLIARLAFGGEITLAGFYSEPVAFAFPPAFMREARLRVAAEWKPEDMAAVVALVADGRLSLSGLITHRASALDAGDAYRTAFDDPACLKMILDWRRCS
ncbi:MAG: chlorophyll synthesis pathway protein BchC [Hyphomicrobiales bacterium]|nr:chlorophyll synthesis pathway protein BchC [Hyphomicrobiales bacterium]